MTAEIVNLRRARKESSRRKDEERAAQNRVTFGTPKPERLRIEAERRLDERRHDGHRRASDDGT